MPRYDPERYTATPDDVLEALGPRSPDPFGHGSTPQTEFTIASLIASDRRLGRPGAPLSKLINRSKLALLLEEMASDGRLVGMTSKEWAALNRIPPSRSKTPLYVTPEKAREWGMMEKARPETDRWTLTIEFDDLKTQSTVDPELTFPHDECSSLIAYIGDLWGMLPEQPTEIAEWTSTRITLQLDNLEFVGALVDWVSHNTVPQNITVTRNEPR
jgi:hypothetical protein